MTTKVLSFHHVLADTSCSVGPQADVRITPDWLRQCLDTHRDWDLVDYRRGLDPDTAPARSLMLTVDDGYTDVVTQLLPVLEAYDAPCLVFMVSGFLDRTVRPMESDAAWLAERLHTDDAEAGFRRLRKRLQHCTADEQHRRMADLARHAGLDYPPPVNNLLLSTEQAQELARHPLITIGAHSVSHPMFRPFDVRLAHHEAAMSKTHLETLIGQPVECFAYPYSRHSVLTRRSVARAGFRYAFTNQGRTIERLDRLAPMAVPRFDIDSDAGRIAAGLPGPAPTARAQSRAA